MSVDLMELSKQGDVAAIARLINQPLQPKGITARVLLRDQCLKVMLESATVPNQKLLAPFIKNGVIRLGIPAIKSLQVYGRKIGEKPPAWTQNFSLPLSESQDALFADATIIQGDSQSETIAQQDKGDRNQNDPPMTLAAQLNHAIGNENIKILVESAATTLKVIVKTDQFLDGPVFSKTIYQELQTANLTGFDTVNIYKQKLKGAYSFQIKSFSLAVPEEKSSATALGQPSNPMVTTAQPQIQAALSRQPVSKVQQPEAKKIRIGRVIGVIFALVVAFFVISRLVKRLMLTLTLSPVFGGFSVILGLVALWRAWSLLNPLLQTLLRDE